MNVLVEVDVGLALEVAAVRVVAVPAALAHVVDLIPVQFLAHAHVRPRDLDTIKAIIIKGSSLSTNLILSGFQFSHTASITFTIHFQCF